MTSPPVPTLETKRLILRPFNDSDLHDLSTSIFADSEVIRYLPRREGAPVDRARRTLDYFISHWQEHGYGAWVVTSQTDPRFIGYCGLNILTENGEVEVLYALAKPSWGKGIATEAARASLWFGFEHIGLEQIVGLAMPENIASQRVLEHTGMVYEREAYYFGLDLVVLSIARAQFETDGSSYRLY